MDFTELKLANPAVNSVTGKSNVSTLNFGWFLPNQISVLKPLFYVTYDKSVYE